MNEDSVKYTPEYRAIKAFYADRTAERSKVPLIAHIDEGLDILEMFGASRDAMRAWCLHPLFQSDEDLARTLSENSLYVFSPRCVALAMEYRARANDWLSDMVYRRYLDFGTQGVISVCEQVGYPDPGEFIEVKQMLIADKVQNYKDFLEFHYGTHERSEELNHYFLEWLKVLQIDEQEFSWMCKQLRKDE